MPQSYKTVSGGNCTLSLWRESSPGVIDSSVAGSVSPDVDVVLAIVSVHGVSVAPGAVSSSS